MAITTDFAQAGRLCDVLGLSATLTLCGWFGRDGSKVYVPTTNRDENHLLRKLVGDDAFEKMVNTWPGEYLSIPRLDLTPLQRAGLVHRLTKHGIPDNDLAMIAGVTRRHVSHIKNQLRLEGFADLSEILMENHPVTESEGGHCD